MEFRMSLLFDMIQLMARTSLFRLKMSGFSHKKEGMKNTSAYFEVYVATFKNCRKRVENSLAMVEAGSLSWDSIKEFTQSLRDIDQVVVDYILKQRGDVFQSKQVLNLVNEYFQASLQTLELLNELENCLKVVNSSDFVLRLATKKFENKKYGETIENLEKFKAKGDPFKEKFWRLYVQLCEKQISLLNKVMQMHVEVNKKVKSKEVWNGVIALLAEAVSAIFIILMAIAKKLGCQETVANVKIEVHTIPEPEPEDTTDCVENEMKKAESVLKTVSTANCVVKEFEDFRAHVLSLIQKITSLSQEAGIGGEDQAAKSVVAELNTKVNKFRDDISNMVAHTRKCKDDIFGGRDKVLGLIKSSA